MSIPFHIKILAISGVIKVKEHEPRDHESRNVLTSGFSGTEKTQKKFKLPLKSLTILIPLVFGLLVALPWEDLGSTTKVVQPPSSYTDTPSCNTILSSDEIMERYKFPTSLQIAINEGDISYDCLPEEFKKFVKP